MRAPNSLRIVACALFVGVASCTACPSLWAAEDAAKEGTASQSSWAYRPPTRPTIPAVLNRSWVRNPIDAFILAKFQEAGLTPAPEADRLTLIRRLCFDLIGVPP